MSLTSVVEATKTNGSVFLTPTKRKRADCEQERPKPPSTADIWKWVFKADAIASCFICDICAMKLFKEKEYEFWWLKRIPCRNVRIVGMVVGAQTFETKISYLVDDGTSVIECVHRCKPPSPQKGGRESKRSVNDPPMPTPLAWIGATVRITGRIHEFGARDTNEEEYRNDGDHIRRQIIVNSIEKCKSANEKLYHWKTVLHLHKTSYSSHEPFTIPNVTVDAATSLDRHDPLISPSVTSTTSTSTATSPTKSISYQQFPRKLRHPSRLHNTDLTGNTFRIYIKHYMDNYPALDGVDTDTYSDSIGRDSTLSSTPTRHPSRSALNNETPRHAVHCDVSDEQTPRAVRNPFSSTNKPECRSPHLPRVRGFTLTYLRRVPELSEMARRVVKAEAKRRDREARKKAREHAMAPGRTIRTQIQDRSWSKSMTSTPGGSSKEISTAARMKRLWKWALVQLLQEGSIVIWDGPTYQCPSISSDQSNTSGLWKHSSHSTSASIINFNTIDVSLFTTGASGHSRLQTESEDENIDLSDPEPDEESYVSLTPEFLAGEVEKAIRVFTTPLSSSAGSRHQSTRNAYKPTKEGILAFLRRDDRWMRVGEWNVEEALEVLKDSGRAFETGRGMWSVTPF